jgi:hypothetical protein
MAAAEGTDWSKLEPNFGYKLFYSKSMKAHLHSGTFVVLKDGNALGRIIDCVGEEKAEVNIFARLADGFKSSDHSPVIPSESHLCYLPMVVQTTTMETVYSADSMELAWVFKLTDLRDDNSAFYFNCQGMDAAFLLDSRFEENKGNYSIPYNECLPFPSSYGKHLEHFDDSYAHSTWRDLMTVKNAVAKVLARASISLDKYFNDKGNVCNVNASSWEYLKRKTADTVTDVPLASRNRVFRLTTNGLDLKRKQMQLPVQLLRFETHSELNGLCHVLGETTLATQRKRAKTARLEINDAVNYVKGSEAAETPVQIRPTDGRHGIDLEYDKKLGEIVAKVRYGRYLFKVDSNGKTIHENGTAVDPLLLHLIDRGDPYKVNITNNGLVEIATKTLTNGDDVTNIDEGAEFELNGVLYVVDHVNDGVVHTMAGNTFNNAHDVLELIKQRLADD